MSYCFYTTLISFSIFQSTLISCLYVGFVLTFSLITVQQSYLWNGIHRYHCYQAFHQSIIRSSCGSFTCPPSLLHPTTSILLQWKHLQDPWPDIVLCSPGRSPTVIWTAVSNEDRRMTTWSWRRARRTWTLGVEAKMEARRCRLGGDGAGAAATHKTRSMRTAWDLVPIGEPIKPTGKEINWSASPPSSARAMPSYW